MTGGSRDPERRSLPAVIDDHLAANFAASQPGNVPAHAFPGAMLPWFEFHDRAGGGATLLQQVAQELGTHARVDGRRYDQG
jgi:hypothetical protein